MYKVTFPFTLCKESRYQCCWSFPNHEVSIYSAGKFCHSDLIYFGHVLVIHRTSPMRGCVLTQTLWKWGGNSLVPRPNPSPRVSWVGFGHDTKEATASSASLLATSRGYDLVLQCAHTYHSMRMCAKCAIVVVINFSLGMQRAGLIHFQLLG